MYIRKRTFLEITFPFTVVFFVCLGMHFLNVIGAFSLRWVFMLLLFLFFFLNKKLLVYINQQYIFFLLCYLGWCISTTSWSEVPILSFLKSIAFAFNVIVMISAGSMWVIKYGYKRSLNWLFLILIISLLSILFGGASSIQKYGVINLYSGLYGNSNAFGFLMAIISPLILFQLYQNKENKFLFMIYLIILATNIYFLLASYTRASFVIFMCVLTFFVLSFSLSKKVLIALSLFFCIVIILTMLPMNYLKNIIEPHIEKSASGAFNTNFDVDIMLNSRTKVWEKSYQQAIKGGMMGGGFAVTIGDKKFSTEKLFSIGYGREKGNSQLAIMEETGVIGLILYGILLIIFFTGTIPYYLRLRGLNKVTMGIALGTIIGLLMESIVEAWWNSVGPEVTCFWTLVGVVYGIIYLEKKKAREDFFVAATHDG